jgi:hypothetical protein
MHPLQGKVAVAVPPAGVNRSHAAGELISRTKASWKLTRKQFPFKVAKEMPLGITLSIPSTTIRGSVTASSGTDNSAGMLRLTFGAKGAAARINIAVLDLTTDAPSLLPTACSRCVRTSTDRRSNPESVESVKYVKLPRSVLICSAFALKDRL